MTTQCASQTLCLSSSATTEAWKRGHR